MPSVTVIDQLVVKLGLDPKDFTKGEKQVAASSLDLEQKVRKSSDSIGSQLGKLAGKYLVIGAVIQGIKKAVTFIDDVSTRTRRLGIDAKNYDTAADRLRNFENAVEMMGGSAEEARRTVAGFQKSIFDLAYNGQVSDSLMMLARLGVQFQTSTGEARDFNDVMLDTADAIAKAQQQGMSRSNAYQFLQQAGFDSGTAQLILSGRQAIEAEQKRQQQRFQVTPGALSGAEKVATARIDKEQQIEALGVKGLEEGAGSVQTTINEAIAHPTEALHKLGDAASHAATVFESWALNAAGISRGLRNRNPGNLKAVGSQARDRAGFAVFKTMEEGVRAEDRQIRLDESRGLDTPRKLINKLSPAADNNDVEAYLKDIQKRTGLGPDEQLNEGDNAMLEAAIFAHESGKGAPNAQDVADILQMQDEAPATPGAAGGGPSFSKTDVQIDNITVNTQAKDAQAMADDLDDSLSRKLLASHAETGMQ